jgi:hypothetical protein
MARAKLQEHFTSNMGGGAMAWSSMYVDQLRPHVVCTTASAASVTDTLKWLAGMELCDVTMVKPDESGVVSVDAVVKALRSATVLVSVPHADGNTGAVQPVADISRAVRQWIDDYGEPTPHCTLSRKITPCSLRPPAASASDFSSMQADGSLCRGAREAGHGWRGLSACRRFSHVGSGVRVASALCCTSSGVLSVLLSPR